MAAAPKCSRNSILHGKRTSIRFLPSWRRYNHRRWTTQVLALTHERDLKFDACFIEPTAKFRTVCICSECQSSLDARVKTTLASKNDDETVLNRLN